jgi:SAM-dependent methyltransferase
LKLKIIKAINDEILEGELRGSRNTVYPIISGIPRFVSNEFYNERLPVDSNTVQTGRSFGNKWRDKTFRILGETQAEIDVLKEQFLSMLGIEEEDNLEVLFQDDMNCLNVGCGVAWSEYLFNVNEKINRFAIDLSLAVEVAYEKTKLYSNVCVTQADLFNLPFEEDYFDIIFSCGVLHHTPSFIEAFTKLCKHLKVGGLIGIYIYSVKPFLRELADKEIRKITTEMSYEECYQFSVQITELGKSLQKYEEPLLITKDIPILGIKKGEFFLQKFIYDHFLKCFFNEKLSYEFSVLTNTDWYHPKYASHHTKDEIMDLFSKNNIEKIKILQPKGWEHSGFFVSGRKK